ncbi:MAG: helix-turn-helix transcriptional regulator [Clostridiales bacterium]|nr:helix-turn-helix transcriptional regulator [Clostridiales bacterium]
MDKIQIGKFISKCRKDKQITQEQLSEMLGVTYKSVSKWENGICLPDASLYEPLCNILDITINELFAGQKIKDEDYKKIADDNLMQMLKHKLYLLSDKSISFDEFDNALTQMANVTTELKAFKDKEEAVDYLMKETGCPFEECSNAYDFYIKLFDVN